MSLLTQSLISDDQQQLRQSRKNSNSKLNSVNLRAYRASGFAFERFTMRKTLHEGHIKRNVFSSAIAIQPPDREGNPDDIVREFQEKNYLAKSGISYHSVNSNNEEFDVTEIDGELFFNAKESVEIDRKVSEIVRSSSIQFPRRESLGDQKAQQQQSQLAAHALKGEKRSRRIYTKKYRSQKIREKNVRNHAQTISQFFGEGINSLILGLSRRLICILSINLFLDWVFRFALLLFCLECYIYLEGKTARFVFSGPIFAELFARVLFFAALIKMNFDEKKQVSLAYQRAVEGKSGSEMEMDRMFLRQFTRQYYFKMFFRAMIPPEFYYWQIRQRSNKLKHYFMINMVFKGMEFVIVLGTLAIILLVDLQSAKENRLDENLRLIGFSLMLEEIIRYVISYLVINTFSH